VLDTRVKVLLVLVPRAVMAVMHTTIISASITAYSTAVGPSSCFRKRATVLDMRDNMTSLFLVQRKSMCPGNLLASSRTCSKQHAQRRSELFPLDHSIR